MVSKEEKISKPLHTSFKISVQKSRPEMPKHKAQQGVVKTTQAYTPSHAASDPITQKSKYNQPNQ